MMRSWGNRSDTFVCDEPLYAHYLKQTEVDHPGREEVIAAHETDWRNVVDWLTGPIPGGKAVFYQKHMTHHLLPEIERGWLDGLTHCFLIRDPREMLTSLIEHLPCPRFEDTGLPQQLDLVRHVQEKSRQLPPIVDARDVLEAPEPMLRKLCGAVSVPFEQSMLSWQAGRRDTDGVWAKYWYESVERSTGFQPYRAKHEKVPVAFLPLLEQCMDCYLQLHALRMQR